jgi:hypothetical protein
VNTRLAAFLSLIAVVVSTFCINQTAWARTHNHAATKQSDIAAPGYVFALAAANRFLHAWQTADLESGTVLLSNGIRHSQNADQLEEFFTNGKDRGFEIARGHGHAGLYTFPVVLVTSRGSKITRKSSEISLVETGKNDWVVDKLP